MPGGWGLRFHSGNDSAVGIDGSGGGGFVGGLNPECRRLNGPPRSSLELTQEPRHRPIIMTNKARKTSEMKRRDQAYTSL